MALADLAFVACVAVAGYGLWHFSPSVTLILAGLTGAAVVVLGAGRRNGGD